MPKSARILAVLLCLLSAVFVHASGKPQPSSKLDAAVAPAMQKLVDDGVISGAVTLVAKADEVLSFQAVGLADIAGKQPMKKDNLFWIASMTKPITGTAVLMLQDEGRLSVEDPVEKYLPEFKGMWMIKDQGTNSRTTVLAPRAITVRDLLTHTSGLGDVPSPRFDSTLAELVMAYSQQPLHFAPGTKWEYCNSGINTLGRIVEVVSGQKYADFIQDRILTPLGMRDTTFWPTPAQAKRIAKSYKPAGEGKGLVETDIYFVKGGLSDHRRTASPAGGLFSTARDMAIFYQMMLNGGIYQGRRIVAENSANALTRIQTGDIKTGFVTGMSWGYGFQVVKEPTGVTAMLPKGTFGHGGAYATQSWADPFNRQVLIMMIQRAGFPNGDDSEARKVFQQAVYSAGNQQSIKSR